jgi:hypothetical protein
MKSNSFAKRWIAGVLIGEGIAHRRIMTACLLALWDAADVFTNSWRNIVSSEGVYQSP